MAGVHPDVEALLAAAQAAGSPPFEALTPSDARVVAAERRKILQLPPESVSEVRDFDLGEPSRPVAVRLYRPVATGDDAVLPCLVYMHGGGWVFGDLESHDALCRRIANQAGCCVISIHYRRAPEHPFPRAVEDCAAVFTAVNREAAALKVDPQRIAVGGDSAGGTLAAVIALMGRDGAVPPPVQQTLIYPVVDLSQSLSDYGPNTAGMSITGATMVYFRDHYTPRPADRADWRASPIKATTFAGLPPSLIITCGHDPLAAEGRSYAGLLDNAGVRVTHLHLSDQTHGMITMTKVNRAAIGLQDFVAAVLRETFASFVPF